MCFHCLPLVVSFAIGSRSQSQVLTPVCVLFADDFAFSKDEEAATFIRTCLLRLMNNSWPILIATGVNLMILKQLLVHFWNARPPQHNIQK